MVTLNYHINTPKGLKIMPSIDYNTKQEVSQEITVLNDLSKTGKKRDWNGKKIRTTKLAQIYLNIPNKSDKAMRLLQCSNVLGFVRAAGKLRLHTASFCRVRLCPICCWRRSLKVGGQMDAIAKKIAEDKPNLTPIMLTLTMPNVNAQNLGSALDKLSRGFGRLVKRKNVSKAIKGYYRGTEITVNRSGSVPMYHPHIHSLLWVNDSYFTSRDYISRDVWLDMWRDIMDDESITQVDIRRVRAADGMSLTSAIAEVAKYAVKDTDYISTEINNLDIDIVDTLDKALNKRRFVGLGGVIKETHAKLQFAAIDNDEGLIQGDEDAEKVDNEVIYTYVWRTGAMDYVLDI